MQVFMAKASLMSIAIVIAEKTEDAVRLFTSERGREPDQVRLLAFVPQIPGPERICSVSDCGIIDMPIVYEKEETSVDQVQA